ncbi:MAG: alpha/beta fold hydrolase, partial [Aeromicrobium sp.]
MSTRARQPDVTGVVERDGVSLAYEVHGDAGPSLLLLPTWSIIDSRVWKAQVPFLARHCRVVTFDGRGSGRSSSPKGAAAYENAEYAWDALAVMDATSTETAIVAGLSCGATWAVHVAARAP